MFLRQAADVSGKTRSGLRVDLGDVLADAARGTGDEGGLSVESHCRAPAIQRAR